jgi:hypothetical protein
MLSTLNYVSPMQFEPDGTDATEDRGLNFAVIEAGRGNGASWDARKTMILFSALLAKLGNR